MKKRICTLMTLVMTASVLVLAGCGGGSKPAETQAPQTTEAATEAVTEAPAETATEALTEAQTEAADVSADYTTIREYLEDPEVVKEIEEIEKNSSNDTVKLEIEAEDDNTLFYKATYVDEFPEEQIPVLQQALEDALNETMESNMLSVKDTIESVTSIKGLKIKMAYYLPDGTLLAEKTFGGE